MHVVKALNHQSKKKVVSGNHTLSLKLDYLLQFLYAFLLCSEFDCKIILYSVFPLSIQCFHPTSNQHLTCPCQSTCTVLYVEREPVGRAVANFVNQKIQVSKKAKCQKNRFHTSQGLMGKLIHCARLWLSGALSLGQNLHENILRL